MRAAPLLAILLAGCGPSLQFLGVGVGLSRAGVARMDPVAQCEPGFGDCPKTVCFRATFEVGSQVQVVNDCSTRDDVHSGHLYRPDLVAPAPVEVGAGGSATLEITSGGAGKKTVDIPRVPNEYLSGLSFLACPSAATASLFISAAATERSCAR